MTGRLMSQPRIPGLRRIAVYIAAIPGLSEAIRLESQRSGFSKSYIGASAMAETLRPFYPRLLGGDDRPDYRKDPRVRRPLARRRARARRRR